MIWFLIKLMLAVLVLFILLFVIVAECQTRLFDRKRRKACEKNHKMDHVWTRISDNSKGFMACNKCGRIWRPK
jgi:heme/copper-type cytochrome/quinol oxidase subunit 2